MTPSSNHLYSPTISFKTLQTFRYFRGNRKEMSVYRFRKKNQNETCDPFLFSQCVYKSIFSMHVFVFFVFGGVDDLFALLRNFRNCSETFVFDIMTPLRYLKRGHHNATILVLRGLFWSTKAHHTFKWIKKSHAWDRHLVKITLKTHLVCVILNESFTN